MSSYEFGKYDFQHIRKFDGKTVAGIDFDGYEMLRIVFTDGTQLEVYESRQAGQIGVGYVGVEEDANE